MTPRNARRAVIRGEGPRLSTEARAAAGWSLPSSARCPVGGHGPPAYPETPQPFNVSEQARRDLHGYPRAAELRSVTPPLAPSRQGSLANSAAVRRIFVDVHPARS